MGQQKFIAVAGNMGSGKSTLVDFLAREYKVRPFFEQNDENPFLESFYKDMKTWAFHSQVFFLSRKARIHHDLERSKGVCVLDRTIYEDAEIFATALYESGKMSKRDFAVYSDLYQSVTATLKPPSLMIYLRCSPRMLRQRIKKRGRQMEQDVPASYLRRLQSRYDNWIANYKASEVLTIETDKLDYISDMVDRLDVMCRIEKHL